MYLIYFCIVFQYNADKKKLKKLMNILVYVIMVCDFERSLLVVGFLLLPRFSKNCSGPRNLVPTIFMNIVISSKFSKIGEQRNKIPQIFLRLS